MADNITDGVLAEQVMAGDDEAFNLIMARYKTPVTNFIYRMSGDAAGAQDTAQDVFVNVFQALRAGRYRATAGLFSTWLFQAARNAVIDAHRKRKRRPLEFFPDLPDGGESLPAAGRTADETAAGNDIGEQIAAAVARLPEDQRTAFVLTEYEGFSYADTAAVMKCTAKSVEARLYRAKQKLRTRLAPLIS